LASGKFRQVAFVYAARALAGPANGLVKIGFTSKVQRPDCRLMEIAMDHVVRGPIDVLWGVTATVSLERELHSWFADRHAPINGRTEWFRLVDDDIQFLLALGSDLPRRIIRPRLRGTMSRSPRLRNERSVRNDGAFRAEHDLPQGA
jgi:hypothetical protein